MSLGVIGPDPIKKRPLCAGLLFFKKFSRVDDVLSSPTSCNQKHTTSCLLIPESDHWFGKKKWDLFSSKKIFSTHFLPKTPVVTHFWTPRAEDGVYSFWTKCKNVAHVWWKIDKSGEINIFFEPCLSCFLLFFTLPFVAKSVRFLMLIRSLHINPSEFSFFKKIDSAAVVNFCSNLGSDSDLVPYDIWPS